MPHSWEIGLREVSALCVRHNGPDGRAELLAVDDGVWAVAPISLVSKAATPQPPVDLVARGLPRDGKSELEGVASDASGRVFLLQEGPSRVLVLDNAMAALEHTIALDVAPEHPDIGATWAAKANSRGEGLLLLRDGHMLIAKQRDPVRLIEFGPTGDPPHGYAPWNALGVDEEFALADSDTSVAEVLATWSLEPTTVESINDLALDIHGRLHFVSSRSRCIGRIDTVLSPDEPVVAASTVQLPAALFVGDDDKAEGLVFSNALGWLVALDLGRAAPNLHQLASVPG